MLEHQQAQLVEGLQESYRRLSAAKVWGAAPLDETDGHILTHDILVALDVLTVSGGDLDDVFEEDTARMRRNLLDNGAPLARRRVSFHSEPDEDASHGVKRGHQGYESKARAALAKSNQRTHHVEPSACSSAATSSAVTSASSNNTGTARGVSPLRDMGQVLNSGGDDDSYFEPTTAWTWKDFGMATEPSFTFPDQQPEPANNASLLDMWPNFAPHAHLDPTMTGTYPYGLTQQYNMVGAQGFQDESPEYDMSDHLPKGRGKRS